MIFENLVVEKHAHKKKREYNVNKRTSIEWREICNKKSNTILFFFEINFFL